MSQQRHVFTQKEGELGVRNARLGRKAWIRFEKKLAQLNLEKETISRILEIAKVVIAKPAGVFLVGWLIVDGLEKIGYFGSSGSSATSPGKTSSSNSGIPGSNLLSAIFANTPFGAGISQLIGLVEGKPIAYPSVTANENLVGAKASSGGNPDAAFLKAGLFSICMAEALGGGAGIGSLATSILAKGATA